MSTFSLQLRERNVLKIPSGSAKKFWKINCSGGNLLKIDVVIEILHPGLQCDSFALYLVDKHKLVSGVAASFPFPRNDR